MNNFLFELIGTAFLILLGDGVVANVVLNKTKGNNSGWIVITFGWAIAVFVGVYISAAHSGAHLNPAVTIALAIIGKFNWENVPLYIAGQFVGAMIGAFLVWVAYNKHFDHTDNADAKLAVFCTSPAISNSFFCGLSESAGNSRFLTGTISSLKYSVESAMTLSVPRRATMCSLLCMTILATPTLPLLRNASCSKT